MARVATGRLASVALVALLALLAFVALVLGLGAGAGLPAAPAGAASAPRVPATHLHGVVCTVAGGPGTGSGSASGSSRTYPTVGADPSAVEAIWIPGLNDRTCRAQAVRGGPAIAAALATDIDHAPEAPRARKIMCPLDDGTAVRLYFTPKGAHKGAGALQRVDADLSGCSFIDAPGTGARSSTAPFRRDLATLAPAHWRSYVVPRSDPTG